MSFTGVNSYKTRTSVYTTHEEEDQDVVDPEREYTTRELVTSKAFILLYCMMTCNRVCTMFYRNSAKTEFGPTIQDEPFKMIIQSVALFIGILNFIWSYFLERFNFKVTYASILITVIAIVYSLPSIMETTATSQSGI